MPETTADAPLWFMIVSGLFLVWNLFGFVIFILTMTKFRKKEALLKAGLTEQQADFTLAAPAWVNVAFGVAVIFGVLGCIALLMKSSLAIPLLVVSLAGVIVQNIYIYFLSDTIKVMGVGASPAVIAGSLALVPFAIYCSNQGWLG